MRIEEKQDLISLWADLGRKCARSKRLYQVMRGRVSLLPAQLRNAFLKAYKEEAKKGEKLCRCVKNS